MMLSYRSCLELVTHHVCFYDRITADQNQTNINPLSLSDSYEIGFAHDLFDKVELRGTAHPLDTRRSLPVIEQIIQCELIYENSAPAEAFC